MSILDTARTRGIARESNMGDAERWASVIGGGVLAIFGLTRRDRGGMLMALMGGGLAARGISGHSRLYDGFEVRRFDGAQHRDHIGVQGPAIRVERAVTINRVVPELFRFWRQLENLPRFMKNVEAVLPVGGNRYHWVVRAPLGGTVEWDAEIVNERENELIAWRSLEGSRIENAGAVKFENAPGGRGTEVKVTLAYKPPAGPLGAAIARMLGAEPGQQVREDLGRFKQLMEAGEIPTTEGQPVGRR